MTMVDTGKAGTGKAVTVVDFDARAHRDARA
jgi:hypothetical protein